MRGISFEAGKGEIFGLLGPNGAGKTTTLRTICTLLAPDSGSINVLGFDTSTVVRGLFYGGGGEQLFAQFIRDNAGEVERRLVKFVPDEFKRHAHHWLILHGRYVCFARSPNCGACVIRDLCEYKDKTA